MSGSRRSEPLGAGATEPSRAGPATSYSPTHSFIYSHPPVAMVHGRRLDTGDGSHLREGPDKRLDASMRRLEMSNGRRQGAGWCANLARERLERVGGTPSGPALGDIGALCEGPRRPASA